MHVPKCYVYKTKCFHVPLFLNLLMNSDYDLHKPYKVITLSLKYSTTDMCAYYCNYAACLGSLNFVIKISGSSIGIIEIFDDDNNIIIHSIFWYLPYYIEDYA